MRSPSETYDHVTLCSPSLPHHTTTLRTSLGAKDARLGRNGPLKAERPDAHGGNAADRGLGPVARRTPAGLKCSAEISGERDTGSGKNLGRMPPVIPIVRQPQTLEA